jgi:hypothetical protein
MNRPSTRLILAGMTAAVLGGSIAAASADSAPVDPKKDHTICLINQDSATGPQHGLCVTIPLLPPPAGAVTR